MALFDVAPRGLVKTFLNPQLFMGLISVERVVIVSHVHLERELGPHRSHELFRARKFHPEWQMRELLLCRLSSIPHQRARKPWDGEAGMVGAAMSDMRSEDHTPGEICFWIGRSRNRQSRGGRSRTSRCGYGLDRQGQRDRGHLFRPPRPFRRDEGGRSGWRSGPRGRLRAAGKAGRHAGVPRAVIAGEADVAAPHDERRSESSVALSPRCWRPPSVAASKPSSRKLKQSGQQK